MTDIKHICLDKDGVILNVHAYWSHGIKKRVLKILGHFNIAADYLEKFALAMGVDLSQERIIPGGPVGYKPRKMVIEAAVKMVKELGYEATDQQIGELFKHVDRHMQENNDYNIQMLPNTERALQRMKDEGLKISIYSSDHVSNLRKNMEHLGLVPYIDAMVGGDEVKQPKPNPEGFKIACERVTVPLSNSIYVGDTLDDMLMAKRGLSQGGYGVTTGLCSAKELRGQTEFVFDSLDAIIKFLVEARKNCTTP